MDYKEKYEAALEQARTYYSDDANAFLIDLFPELAESKGEKMIRAIIDALYSHTNSINLLSSRGYQMEDIEAWLAWLEKQKTYEPNDEDERIRKWLYNYISNCPNENFEFYGGVGRDAVLAYLEKQKEQPKEERVYCLNGLMQDYIKDGKDEEEREHRLKCYQLFWDALEDTTFFEQKEQKPESITNDVKEYTIREDYTSAYYEERGYKNGYADGVRDTKAAIAKSPVEQKPKWEINNPHTTKWTKEMIDEKFEELVDECHEQKLAEWHPEDEQNLNVCLSYIKDEHLRSWLIDAIHVRYDNPAEWSEEDEKQIAQIERIVKNAGCAKMLQDKIHNWLKSLCPSWKPSEEQMEALEECGECKRCIKELYEQLKNL